MTRPDEALSPGLLRTPDERFAGIADWDHTPRYVTLQNERLGAVRVAVVEEGPAHAEPVLLLHGEPTWSFLWRKVVPPILAAGGRVVVPDLVGFGRSDKPTQRGEVSYARQVAWTRQLVERLDLRGATLVCQDWGSLIGLRVLTELPDRFARVVVANGALPDGVGPVPREFRVWRTFARWSPVLPCGRIVDAGTVQPLAPAVRAAYDAPFPSRGHQVVARVMPSLVPTEAGNVAAADNRRAWEVLRAWEKPFLTAFSDADPVTRQFRERFIAAVPGAQGQPHPLLEGGGHFLQEDVGPELGRAVVDLLEST